MFAIGEEVDLTYRTSWLGNDLGLLGKLPAEVADAFAAAERPALILGGGGLKAGAQGATLALVKTLGLIKDGWNGYNVVHLAAARMGGLMLGYGQAGGIADLTAAAPKLLFLLGADDVDTAAFARSFKVYVGHHGDAGAAAADVVLPGAAYSEKPGTYVNTEGRVQRGDRAVFPPGDAREDWAILRALSDVLGHKLPIDSFDQLRAAMAGRGSSAGRRGPRRLRLVGAPARRHGSGPGRLSDQGLLPHQPDRARQRHDAALLGGADPRTELRGGGGMRASVNFVMPAQAGISCGKDGLRSPETLAFAGVTDMKSRATAEESAA